MILILRPAMPPAALISSAATYAAVDRELEGRQHAGQAVGGSI
jgi:hypothetical protein